MAGFQQTQQVMSDSSTDTIRAVLLGKTGVGKSSLGNTLLGRDAFQVCRGLKSGTERCQWADAEVDDVNLQVTDTPGLSDTHRPQEDVLKEVGKSIAVASPGPHIILMVMRCDGRFTEEEVMAYVTLKEMFGPTITQYMILVFVGADAFGETLGEQQREARGELQRATGRLKLIMDEVPQGRIFAVNNKASKQERYQQACELLNMMRALKHDHRGTFFENDISDKVNQLVVPMVQEQMARGHVTETEAIRQTNREIVDESHDASGKLSRFFSSLAKVMVDKVAPFLSKAVPVALGCLTVANEIAGCELM
ncbi:GTPase IMAP family member 4-like isoform X1 [Babylonia areolata]|uniref:GTPase IMAP family member 4-like isoform X1 n=1 Tax=Babylonia areolata TaxID=304850 RepID=UPI003FD2CB95